MTASSDYSSSEDEAELSRLQSVAVSGQAVAAGAAAAPSHKKSARQKGSDAMRTGGVNDGRDNGIVEDKLWKALALRLDGDLDCQQLAIPPANSGGLSDGDRDTHSAAQPQPDDCSIRLFRQVQTGTPLRMPAGAPDTDAAGGSRAAGAAAGAAAPADGDGEPLTKRRRAQLEKQERRRQEKARKWEAPQPAAPVGPVAKIAEALKAAADGAHYSAPQADTGPSGGEAPVTRAGGSAAAGVASTGAAAAASGDAAAPELTERERNKLRRIAKNERRKQAGAVTREAKKIVKSEHHKQKYQMKQQKKAAAAKASAAAPAADAGGANAASAAPGAAAAAAAALPANSSEALVPAGKLKGKKAKKEHIGVKRGKFSKAKVKKRVKAKQAAKAPRTQTA